MAKDINIHLKTKGAERTKQQLGGVAQASKQVGDKTAEGHKEGAGAVDKTTQKMTGMGRVLGNLKSQVLGFIGGFLGLQAVIKLVDYLQQKLQRIQQIQEQLYRQSVSMSQIGQALEFQTGTKGMQQFWTKLALQLQAAGGLPSPEVAQQMMISMDIAFSKQGGIKSQQIQELARQLAPFVGAAGLGPQEVAKVFEFAGTAGIAPTEQGYKEYFAKLQAGYTASKATNFGQFMEGLQKGGTAYMSMGGTLEEAISAFAAARSVMANEALAATLLEQVSRLSSGAYAKPRQAIEKKMGVSWEKLSMDERMKALLGYVETVPESRRGEVLAEQGFPVELTTQIGKMVSPEAKRTMEATREQVANATVAMIEQQMQAYMESILAEQRRTEAEIAGKEAEEGLPFALMLRHLNQARKDFDISAAKGQDRWLRDSIEPQILAIESLIAEIEEFYQTAPMEMRPQIRETIDLLRERLKREKVISFEPVNYILKTSNREIYKLLMNAAKASEAVQTILDEGTESSRDLENVIRNISIPKKSPLVESEPVEGLPPPVEPSSESPAAEQGPVTINYNYDNGLHYHPRIGSDESGPRVAPGVMV